MSSPIEPQDPAAAPDGQGSSNPPEGTPAPGQGGVPQGRPTEPSPLPPYDQGEMPQYGQYAGQPGQQPGQPPAGEPYAQPYPAVPVPASGYGFSKNNLAVWSLALGIVGLFLCSIFTSIPGIIVGANARRAVARGEANNGSLATAGFWVSWIVTIIQVILGILAIIVIVDQGGWNNVYRDYPFGD